MIQAAADRLKQHEAPADILRDLNEGRVLDLTGCTADQMISLLDQNIPVIGMLDTQNAVILVGYVDYSLIYIRFFFMRSSVQKSLDSAESEAEFHLFAYI